jgi:hypothetical protein
MEPAKIRDDVDPDSKEYRRALIIVVFIVLGLGTVGGTCLGMKISGAEDAKTEKGETETTKAQDESNASHR